MVAYRIYTRAFLRGHDIPIERASLASEVLWDPKESHQLLAEKVTQQVRIGTGMIRYHVLLILIAVMQVTTVGVFTGKTCPPCVTFFFDVHIDASPIPCRITQDNAS